MSSTYSGDPDNAHNLSHVASTRFSDGHGQRTTNWVVEVPSRSGKSSISPSLSPTASQTDLDLDLDSLFKRLDKYTAEMEEVEARLKRIRTASEDSNRINIKRFSLEMKQMFGFEEVLGRTGADSQRKMSSRQSNHVRKSLERHEGEIPGADKGNVSEDGEIEDFDEPLIIQSNATDVIVFGSETEGITRSSREMKSRFYEESMASSRTSLQKADDVYIPDQRKGDHPDSSPEPMTDSSAQVSNPERQSPPPDARRFPFSLHPYEEAMGLEEHHAQLHLQRQDQEQANSLEAIDYSDLDEPGPSVPTSWILPPRTSSKPLTMEDAVEQMEGNRSKPLQRRTATDNRQSVRHGGFWSAPSLKSLEQEPVPPLPTLSQSGSIATVTSSPPTTPHCLWSPREDQIRRELESFAFHDGAETLELKYTKRRPPKLNLINSDNEDLDIDDQELILNENDKRARVASEPSRPRPRRSKSILSIFQRKSPVEKVIDMYFDDEPDEKPLRPPSRWATISRRGSPTTANMPKSPRVPPLPRISPEPKQTSSR